MNVIILWHVHELSDDREDVKLIGVYASIEDAEAARKRLEAKPGFRDLPDGVQVDEYTIGQDHWTDGYITAKEALEALEG